MVGKKVVLKSPSDKENWLGGPERWDGGKIFCDDGENLMPGKTITPKKRGFLSKET